MSRTRDVEKGQDDLFQQPAREKPNGFRTAFQPFADDRHRIDSCDCCGCGRFGRTVQATVPPEQEPKKCLKNQ
ncbi:MAG TPA: hypothetical protein VNQ14_08475 [Woeseiaceae bacterium]|nr:hypothetical protein [Woeseiaceae bacterium]